MEKLVVFLAVLSIAFAMYPDAQTWSWIQVETAISRAPNDIPTEPDFKRCLTVAFDFLMVGQYEGDLINSGVAVIPAPSGSSNWTIRELTRALNIIAKYEGVAIKTRLNEHDTSYWTIEQLHDLVTAFPDGKVDRSEGRRVHEINNCIIFTMYGIAKNTNNFNFDKDTFPVLLPAVDVSIWKAADLDEALTDPNTKADITPYLQRARNDRMQHSNDGKKYCVVTPVGLMPQKEPYYYLPKATKRLLNMAKGKRLVCPLCGVPGSAGARKRALCRRSEGHGRRNGDISPASH